MARLCSTSVALSVMMKTYMTMGISGPHNHNHNHKLLLLFSHKIASSDIKTNSQHNILMVNAISSLIGEDLEEGGWEGTLAAPNDSIYYGIPCKAS